MSSTLARPPTEVCPPPLPTSRSPTLFASSQGRVFADLSGGAVASEDLVRIINRDVSTRVKLHISVLA